MDTKTTLTILGAVLLGGILFTAGKKIETQPLPAMISVTGEGKVTAAPDIASLSFGVQTGRVPTAQAAMELLSNKMNAVIDAVKAQGIDVKDIRTESLNLSPAYDWKDGVQVDQGFEASQSLQVKVRDLAKIGEVLSAAAGAGSNQIGGVSFTIDDPEILQNQARTEAIAKAEAKAKELAKELGVRIVKLQGFSEGGGSIPPIYYERAMMDSKAGGGVASLPVPTGEQDIIIYVTLTYEIR